MGIAKEYIFEATLVPSLIIFNGKQELYVEEAGKKQPAFQLRC